MKTDVAMWAGPAFLIEALVVEARKISGDKTLDWGYMAGRAVIWTKKSEKIEEVAAALDRVSDQVSHLMFR